MVCKWEASRKGWKERKEAGQPGHCAEPSRVAEVPLVAQCRKPARATLP